MAGTIIVDKTMYYAGRVFMGICWVLGWIVYAVTWLTEPKEER